MTEEINTGGLKRFIRKGREPKLNEEMARKIDKAYEKAGIRKAREKRNKIIFLIILIIIILLISGFFIFF